MPMCLCVCVSFVCVCTLCVCVLCVCVCVLQEMEDMVKQKESEVERVEEQGCALVQNKTDEACAIVMETLQSVNHTWANLDHLVRPPSSKCYMSFKNKTKMYVQRYGL